VDDKEQVKEQEIKQQEPRTIISASDDPYPAG